MPDLDGSATTYDVPCACGHALRGTRKARSQAVRCPICARPVFVLALSPYGRGPRKHGASPRARASAGRFSWALPLGAGLAVLGLLVAGFLLLLPWLERRAPVPQDGIGSSREARDHVAAGRQALAEGLFHQAEREFETALAIREQQPDALTSAEARQAGQLLRESALLAALLSKSLEEIIREAMLVRSQDEWLARFRRDYQGKAVLFHDEIRSDVAGRPMLGHYQVRVGDRVARPALEDMKLLRELPTNPPQRWLFGGRLAGLVREPGGGWAIHFDPDSAVLLTEPSAAAAYLPSPLDDELLGLLQRQAELVKR